MNVSRSFRVVCPQNEAPQQCPHIAETRSQGLHYWSGVNECRSTSLFMQKSSFTVMLVRCILVRIFLSAGSPIRVEKMRFKETTLRIRIIVWWLRLRAHKTVFQTLSSKIIGAFHYLCFRFKKTPCWGASASRQDRWGKELDSHFQTTSAVCTSDDPSHHDGLKWFLPMSYATCLPSSSHDDC